MQESKPLLSAEPQSVSTKPSVPCAEASWSVLVISVSVTYTIIKPTLNILIEHLEEEEVRVKLQISIMLHLYPLLLLSYPYP